jgi:hypothetical protein
MRTCHILWLSGCLLGLVSGCNAVEPSAEDGALGQDSQALNIQNGSNLNGSNLNGSNLNGSNLNGSNLNTELLNQTLVAVRFAGARREGLTGNKLDTLELRGTVFHGTQASSQFSGLDFDEATFVGELGSGATVALRVEGITPGTGVYSDIWTYRVSYLHTDGLWYPACKGPNGEVLNAVPVNGYWDYRHGVPTGGAKINDPARFTFACESSAITKCMRFGYRPWATVGGKSLADHHQACTRLIRADFCGDGTSYTTTGQWVNLYDALGIQQDTEDWVIEAEWDTQGARCFYPLNRSHAGIPCYDDRATLGCGAPANFQLGALLMNETPSGGLPINLGL